MHTKISLYMPTRWVAEVECDRGFELMTLDNLIDWANGKNATEFAESNSDRETPFLSIDSADNNIHLRYAHGDFEKIREEVKAYLEFRGVDQNVLVSRSIRADSKGNIESTDSTNDSDEVIKDAKTEKARKTRKSSTKAKK